MGGGIRGTEGHRVKCEHSSRAAALFLPQRIGTPPSSPDDHPLCCAGNFSCPSIVEWTDDTVKIVYTVRGPCVVLGFSLASRPWLGWLGPRNAWENAGCRVLPLCAAPPAILPSSDRLLIHV